MGETSVVPVSGELFAPTATGVEICYQTYGDPTDPPMLLVMGLSSPMTWWDPELCSRLARQGFHVIRCDNRDVGRSTKLSGRVTRSMLVRGYAGLPVQTPYSLADMADDLFGLLDHLDLDDAHLVGVSMGGMIVQTMALQRPERVRSLTSMMSTTGRRSVGFQSPRLLPSLLRPRRPGRTAYAEASVAMWHLIGSPGFPHDDDVTRQLAGETFDRGVSASGTLRQMMAIITQPDRTSRLRELRMPTLVVHGLSDRMVHVSGGRATARAVPGAELLLVDGLGHDLPPDLFDTFVEAITRTARRGGP